MSEGKRPGGLTALAIINFVFGANGILSTLALLFVSTLLKWAGEQDEEALRMAEKWDALGPMVFYSTLVLTAAVAALMIASGVGYLQQKRFLGRTLGNAFAVASIASSVIWAIEVKDEELGGGFNILTIIGVIYPVLTLILINTTFKEDLTR